MIDRAVDAWGAHSAGARKAVKVLSHVAVALAYALTYLVLRQASNDQWYLPAGLRFILLLVSPYRFWPALYAGDIFALGIFRYPMIPHDGLIWVSASVFPVWPAVALIVRQLRKTTTLPQIRGPFDAGMFVGAALIGAELPSLLNKTCSALLRANSAPIKLADLFVYTMGHLQGILLFSFATIYIFGKSADTKHEHMFRVEAACTAVLCGLLALGITSTGVTDLGTLEVLRWALLVPAVTLSLRFGYRGACIGAIASNIALFWTIPHQDAGLSDSAALFLQEAFAFVGCTMFVLGAGIYGRSVESNLSSVAAREARELAKAVMDTSESQMRDRALRAEQLTASHNEAMRSTILWLRQNGHSEVAMGLVGIAHNQASVFRRIITDSLYPLTLERDGLFAALNTEAFRLQFDTASVECNLDLLGSARLLSIETQRAVYRVIGDAVDYLLSSVPECMQIRVRCTTQKGRGHVSIAIYARDPRVTSRSSVDTARLARLRTHASAYEGSFHSRAHRIRIILLDSATEPPQDPPRRQRPTLRVLSN